MIFRNVKEILSFIITWEHNLDEYYNHLQRCLSNERSRSAVRLLKAQQDEILDIIGSIDTKEYDDDFVRNVADYHKEEIMASLQINQNCRAADLLEKILDCEEKLEAFYTQVRKILDHKKSIDLFDLLIRLKVLQIRRIKELLHCNVAV